MALQHLRSSTADKRPTPGAMSDGQLALNTNLASPGLFFKDSNGDSVKIGPVHVGTTAPNVTPGAGGQAGNSKGEQWLDTSSSRYVFKIWDGTAWRTEDGEFVNASGDTMTGALVMDNQQQVRFRETTANGSNFIAIQAPTSVAADRTLTLPDVTGTIVSTGDTGSVTSTMILDGTILNADINASAAIVDTKLATIATAGKVSGTAITSGNISTSGSLTSTSTITGANLIPTGSGVPTNGIYLPAANQVAVATNGVQRLTVDTAATTSTLPVVHPLGAVGTPSITFTGDLNTGIWSPAADTVAASTAGSERLRITSAGLVGIGTSTPTTHLDVVSSTTTQISATTTDATGASIAGLILNQQGSGASSFLVRAGSNYTVLGATTSTPVLFFTSNLTRMTITAGGLVGIGATSPGAALEINAAAATSPFIAKINTAEAARIDASARLLVGTSTSVGGEIIQSHSTGGDNLGVGRFAASSGSADIVFYKSRSGTVGTNTIVSSSDSLGFLQWKGADGTGYIRAAGIEAFVDGTPGTNDMPGRLVFSTTADGASSPTERFRIRANGLSSFFNTGFVIPETDNATALGGTTNRWSAVYAVNGTIQTSDERAKTDITNATLGSDFVKALRPVSYKWIEGGQRHTGDYDKNNNFIYESVPGSRTHWGFIAQEVKEAVDAAGVDFGGWVLTDKDDPDSQQALRYDQFIAPLTKALQEALVKIEQLEQRLADAGI